MGQGGVVFVSRWGGLFHVENGDFAGLNFVNFHPTELVLYSMERSLMTTHLVLQAELI